MIKTKKWVAILWMLSQGVFAANFTISPSGSLPTQVAVGQTVSAIYTVLNNTHSTRSGYQVQGLPSGVVQNATPPNCPNLITLGPVQSCQLQLDISKAVSSNFAICKGNSCTTATTPLNVTSASTPVITEPFAFITEGTSNIIQVCHISTVDGTLTNCVNAGGNLSGTQPQGIVIDRTGTHAFITQGLTGAKTVNQCVINPVNHTFDSCSGTVITAPTYNSRFGLLALSNDGGSAFIVGSSPARILACPITSGVIGSTCTDTGATNLSVNSFNVGIVLNPAQTKAYIGSASINDGFVDVCDVAGTTFSNCTKQFGDGVLTFTLPSGVALNPAGNILFVADGGSSAIYACDTAFNNCITSTLQITSPWNITMNKAGTIAYVTDDNTLQYTCPVLPDNTFGVCIQSIFSDPVSVALFEP